MRVLFVTHAYPRWDGDVAGAFIERLGIALRRRGHTVSVLAPADRGRGGEEDRFGVTVRRVRYAPARAETLAYRGTMVQALRSPIGLVALASLLGALRRAVQGADVDVVHAHWWVPAGVAVRRAARVPYVVTLHGTDVALLERLRPIRPVARRVLGRAAAVTAVSTYLARQSMRWTGLDLDVLVQPMPVEVTGDFSRGGGGVVTVGRLSPQKRTELVLEAVARLRREGRLLPLTIVGDGPERERLGRKAQELGIGGTTRFVGSVEPAALSGVLGDADVLAFPAKREGFGLAAAEALMLGIPVVAMEDGGGALDVVPRTGPGRVVPAGDVGELARALSELAGNPDARRAAQAVSADLKAKLSADHAAEVFERVYERATQSSD